MINESFLLCKLYDVLAKLLKFIMLRELDKAEIEIVKKYIGNLLYFNIILKKKSVLPSSI